MNYKKSILHIVGAGAVLALCAGNASANLLTNPGFETPSAVAGDFDCNAGGGTGCTGWQTYQAWGGPFIVTSTPQATGTLAPHGGTQMVKAFGPNSGGYQDFAVNPGDTAGGSIWVASTLDSTNFGGSDDLTGVAIVDIDWLDGGGTSLGLRSFGTTYDPSSGDPVDTWKQIGVEGTAPAGAAFARFVFNVNSNPGAAFFDDADFGIAAVPVPAAVWLFGSGLLGLVGIARHKKG